LKLHDLSIVAASELKRAQNKVEAADGMWFNNNESNNWESDHLTYFGLHFILFEHLELLEHRATLTAGKTMLFCITYSRKISSFLVVSAYLA